MTRKDSLAKEVFEMLATRYDTLCAVAENIVMGDGEEEDDEDPDEDEEDGDDKEQEPDRIGDLPTTVVEFAAGTNRPRKAASGTTQP